MKPVSWHNLHNLISLIQPPPPTMHLATARHSGILLSVQATAWKWSEPQCYKLLWPKQKKWWKESHIEIKTFFLNSLILEKLQINDLSFSLLSFLDCKIGKTYFTINVKIGIAWLILLNAYDFCWGFHVVKKMTKTDAKYV